MTKHPLQTKKDLKETHFKIENDNDEWLKFSRSTLEVVLQDVTEGVSEPTEPLLSNLEKHMQHWTSETGDILW